MKYTLFPIPAKRNNIVIRGCADCPFFERNQMNNSFCKLNYIEFNRTISEEDIPKTIPENCELHKNDIRIMSMQRFVNRHSGWEDWEDSGK